MLIIYHINQNDHINIIFNCKQEGKRLQILTNVKEGKGGVSGAAELLGKGGECEQLLGESSQLVPIAVTTNGRVRRDQLQQ